HRPAEHVVPALRDRPGHDAGRLERLHHRRPAGGEAAMTATSRPGAPRPSDRARSQGRLGWYLAGPAFVIMLAVTLYPIVQAVIDSLYNFRLTAPDERAFIGLRNYGVVLGDERFWQSLGVTLLITEIKVEDELDRECVLAMLMQRAKHT